MSNQVGGYVFGIAFILCGIIVMFMSLGQSDTARLLAARGVHVTGTVQYASIWEHNGNTKYTEIASGPTYSLAGVFPIGQGSRQFNVSVTSDAYKTHPAGSQVEVIYDPQNPAVLELGGGLSDQSSGSTRWGGLLAFVVGLGSVVFTFLYFRRQAKEDHVDSLDEAIEYARDHEG